MASFVLLFLLAVTGGAVCQSSDSTEPMCYDWGESSEGAVSVLDGEAGSISCPLFSHPSVYNYTSAQSAGHNLFWYRLLEGHDLEQPIPYSLRLSRDRERLWLQPAVANDTGQYICMLRNKSSCSKIAMRLKVLRRDEVIRSTYCDLPVATAPTQELIPMQEGKTLDCPDLQDIAKVSESEPTVKWYYENSKCYEYPFWDKDREQQRTRLRFYTMLTTYQGLYFCTVQYQRRGRMLNFTRSINVSAIYPLRVRKEPTILHPTKDKVFSVRTNTDVRLACKGLLPLVLHNTSREIWWTVDGKRVTAANDRFSQINSLEKNDYGDLTEESVLVIEDFQPEDLKREFNCSVRNAKGFETRRAQLQEEVSLPTVELGCGLGITLLLMLLLFMIYHVFWLELLLLYRSWFGTDERHTDDKEFDVYISYARNSEEEQFVLSTLRNVLENVLGYSVCIFDRDSLPGGNLSESILLSMKRSRRLLFVLSPEFLAEKSFSLLECRLALYLQHGHQASVVTVIHRSVRKIPCMEVAQLRQASICTVTWRGSQSEPRRSRFWLRLRLALPVRPLALGRRMIDSTSSHSDLAALALQRAQRIRKQRDRAEQRRTTSRTSSTQNYRDRKTLSRGRSCVKREEGLLPSRRCSGCTGFVGQAEEKQVEHGVQTEIQQVICERTDRVTETDCNLTPDPAQKTNNPSFSPNPTPKSNILSSSSEPILARSYQETNERNSIHQHDVVSLKTSNEMISVRQREEIMPPSLPTENPV
ncbi:interleukin-1 receptor accessory protein isoform X2 [Cyprinodon tularosa]|uniref:interleukin-1 receptor accessory protein isoform X2 n=1 Tax=Cyprinodon tularosa TaxID=77115 RepID=UPI0018E25961|nr:interleukin-1 receptor accessory protein isoform X2 [Cyprinodon tularosa]